MKPTLLALAASFLIPLTTTQAQWLHEAGELEPHSSGVLVQPFTQAERDASNFAPPESVEWFRGRGNQDRKLMALLESDTNLTLLCIDQKFC